MKSYTGEILSDPQAVASALAAQLVADIQAALQARGTARVIFSTGATPVQTYAVLRARYRDALPWDKVCVQQLDEYSGLMQNDPRRFSTFLQEHLVGPLGTGFSGFTGEESTAALAACDADIAATGGLDVVLYGVGVNGHLGFNEPGSPFDAPTRRVVLHASTQARIDTQLGQAPSEAVTLGLGTLHAARRIRVVAWGEAKRQALAEGLLQAPGTQSPLSSLQLHPDVRFYLDAAAAPAGLQLVPSPDLPV